MWEVMKREIRPDEYDAGAGTAPDSCCHIRPLDCTLSLCRNVAIDDGWTVDDVDLHPEDVDNLDRCRVCWSVFERERRAIAGRDPLPSQNLSWNRKRVSRLTGLPVGA